MNQTQVIQDELNRRFAAGRGEGAAAIDVLALDLHDSVARYWKRANRMPNVCRVMRDNKQDRDVTLHSTPSGQSSTLKIRYILPR